MATSGNGAEEGADSGCYAHCQRTPERYPQNARQDLRATSFCSKTAQKCQGKERSARN